MPSPFVCSLQILLSLPLTLFIFLHFTLLKTSKISQISTVHFFIFFTPFLGTATSILRQQRLVLRELSGHVLSAALHVTASSLGGLLTASAFLAEEVTTPSQQATLGAVHAVLEAAVVKVGSTWPVLDVALMAVAPYRMRQ